MFKDIDEEWTTERELRQLKQNRSSADYTVKFQQIAANTQWNIDAQLAQFYFGLKDDVKDEITRSDRPNTMAGMIEKAI